MPGHTPHAERSIRPIHSFHRTPRLAATQNCSGLVRAVPRETSRPADILVRTTLPRLLSVFTRRRHRAREAGLNKDDSLDQALAELLHHSPTTRATPKGGSCSITVEDLLTGIDADVDSRKPSMVDPRGFEPL
jgi:hypothetical protein